ncbi:ABC transporter permease [Methanoplanus sp. FWC-SCC4]|uniref:ABC transporter permease n=1 Tax=Methanochimaera problematica TaxID=2609417 RepID=A0AA97FGB3_9EURY|nr:ABC transporter permease [Methanoplanus sp. FWC-SCC4]WOF16911.1 ABC transporter permease [Methanoplanus sp. FWC-SCC4]
MKFIKGIFFEFAKRSVRLHLLRSSLAVIGIVIGVAAISAMGMLGNSLVLSVSESLSDVGDSIVIYPHGGVSQGPASATTDDKITERMLKDIKSAAGPNDVIPIYSTADTIEVGGEDGIASVYGMKPTDIPIMLDLEEGQWLKSSSGAIAGTRIADEFDLKIGSKIKLGDKKLRIVGILKERGMGFDINPDYAIIVEDKFYKSAYDQEDYDQVIVKVRDINEIDSVKSAIEKKMNRKDDVINAFDTKAILETILDTFGKISMFTTAIGGISLIVAGVSIFNVQMMSVTERIKEIGIIRSIGTQKSEVMKMFLYEALILGFFGAAVGALFSFLGGYLAIYVMLQETSYLFEPSTLVYIPFGMAFGIATSLLSGIYPAWKAANLNPIEALRHE